MSRTQTLGLFRSLLRGASYLPDPAFKSYIKTKITQDFRNNQSLSPHISLLEYERGIQQLLILQSAIEISRSQNSFPLASNIH